MGKNQDDQDQDLQLCESIVLHGYTGASILIVKNMSSHTYYLIGFFMWPYVACCYITSIQFPLQDYF